MPTYPQQTFPTFADLLAFINTNWITNGNGDIDAIIGNDVVNGLLTFVEQSPLNYQTAQIFSTGGVIGNPRPVSVFMTVTPASLQWPDNIYNQYFFINTTSNAIPIGGGLLYYDINLVPQTSIPAKSVVAIMKVKNGTWISIYNAGGSGALTVFGRLQFTVGDIDSPIVEGGTLLTITVTNPSVDSEAVILDGTELYRGLIDRISYTIIYNPTNIQITFNQGVVDDQVYLIRYASN